MSITKDIIRFLKNGPRSEKRLRADTGAPPKKLSKAIKSLLAEQKIVSIPGGYKLAGKTGVKTGKKPFAPAAQDLKGSIPSKIVKLGASFGFAAPLDESGDIFVPGRALSGAMPGDVVAIKLFERPRVAGSREGEVLAVTEPITSVVGLVEYQNGRLFVRADNAKDTLLKIKKGAENGAKPGDKVAVEFVQRAAHHDDHRVRVVMKFGSSESAKDCTKAILYGAGVQKKFEAKVEEAAAYVSATGIKAEDFEKRKDLRRQPIFTIDSASTKDIDDAVSATRLKSGYTLQVHIADVSHYVLPKSTLDEEALHRGTSVYYADSVAPMLPKALSNGICSLNPMEDRLAFSCLMKLDENGNMIGYEFKKSVIKSRVKGVYAEINEILDGRMTPELEQKYEKVLASIEILWEIYQKLSALRAERGSMEIESEEAKLLIDEKGICVGVEKRTRGEAERMIEEFMLMANTAAARLAKEKKIPFLYRVHESPAQDRIDNLKNALAAAGVSAHFEGNVPTQKELAAILDETRGKPLERFVHTAVLRSMAKAKYEPVPKGHFGLALADYAHFTSPIRRYPDLAIHRILSDLANGVPAAELRRRYEGFAQTASQISSEKELTAQRVERDCDDCYKAEYMRGFIGDTFAGVISSVMQFGIYVELENTVEGLIHVSHLSSDHMDLVEGISLTDPIMGKSYRIGDAVKVKVISVNVSQGNVDFDLAE